MHTTQLDLLFCRVHCTVSTRPLGRNTEIYVGRVGTQKIFYLQVTFHWIRISQGSQKKISSPFR